VKVGDVVHWTLPMYLGEGLTPSPPVMGVIVEMHIGNGANVAWFADDMRITWVPLLELEVVSESR
tara:strand:- start:277 stop:471 length:195 start_codon:yes stop_codon:yes gene_type:complete